ncbi:MAG: hypothetical protein IKL40_05910 [Clostridia bacterium]|nr:hypothetical protein [Clostridia bacterium]
MHFNLTLPDFDGLSDASALQQIKGYLTILNEQLRYMMLNIDEDNLTGSLSESLGNVSNTQELIRSFEKTISSLDERVTHISQNMGSFVEKEKKLLLDDEGRLHLDTGFGNIPFSLGIINGDNGSCLAVYNSDGNMIGSLELNA